MIFLVLMKEDWLRMDLIRFDWFKRCFNWAFWMKTRIGSLMAYFRCFRDRFWSCLCDLIGADGMYMDWGYFLEVVGVIWEFNVGLKITCSIKGSN